MADMGIFTLGNAFRVTTMVEEIQNLPALPSVLGDLEIFEEAPSRTDDIYIEEQNGVLTLVQTDERGAAPKQVASRQRSGRSHKTVRLAQARRITAAEVQGVRAFGSTTEMMQVQDLVAERQLDMDRDISLTEEFQRMGAIKGVVLDADGTTVIKDWYAEYGIAANPVIQFDFAGSTTTNPTVKPSVAQNIVRPMIRALHLPGVTPGFRPFAVCGDAFWDALTNCAETRALYLAQEQATQLGKGDTFGKFDYGGVTWINYFSSEDGKVGVATNECQFFPTGVRKVFKVARSPAERFEFVNTPGLRRYSWLVPDDDRNMFVDVEEYSYPLYVCTKPLSLFTAKIKGT